MGRFETAPVLPGETFAGKYRVERILGQGGMGIVVAARHLELDERVAIKFLLRKDDPVASERFAREARAAAKVKNEHVCRVHDVGRLETGESYLVMEYLEGRDLAARLAAEKRLPVELVATWIIEACVALADAHAIGIVHRDLKPANLFLAKRTDGSEHVKLLDFGISKLLSSENMTSTSATMGTPIYMSPEQIASARDVDHRADVWSLGVILYELLSGKPPFAGDSLVQLVVQIREAELPPLGGVPARLAEIVARCLEKDPAKRLASVGELAVALAPFADADAAHLAKRLVSPKKAALAETLDGGPRAFDDPVPASTPAPEEAPKTLEPISRASDRTPPSPTAKWPRAALAAGAVIVTAAVLLLLARSERPVSTPDATAFSPPVLPDVSAVTQRPPPTPSEPLAVPDAAPLASPPPRATHAPLRATASTPVASAPVMTDPPPKPSASPEPASPKRRTLDRSDPYAH
jgi:serine/threonine-protein kinase